MAFEKTSWDAVDPALRVELEALLTAPSGRFHSDFNDAVAWWLLLVLACVLGGGAALWDLSTSSVSLGDSVLVAREEPLAFLRGLLLTPQYVGLLAALVVGPWVAVTWARNHGRRGLALTSTAVVLVRGRKLKVLRYADVASAETRVVGARGKRFTVVKLTLKAGGAVELYANGGWGEEAKARIGGGAMVSA